MFPATLNTDEDFCDCGASVSKTYKEQEDSKALSKNNGSNIRFKKRKQQELEASIEQKEALRRLAEWDAAHGYGRTDYEDNK